jgi:hypothetical protein
MGASNVGAVLTVWGPQLGQHHAARVALVVMANTSLDRDRCDKATGQVTRPKCVYFAGWEPIAWALGYEVDGHERGKPLSCADRVRLQHVSRHIDVLTKLGAITMVQRPAPGEHTAHYLIRTVTPERQPLKGSSGKQRLPLRGTNGYPSGEQRLPLRGTTVTPEGHPKEYEETVGAKSGPISSSRGQSRTREASKRKASHDRARAKLDRDQREQAS